jgi:AraC-like DNA-binding protein
MKGGEELAKNWSALAQEANYSTEALASLCGLSIRQLERNFKQTMAQSPKQWLNALRLEAARKLLQDGGSVKEAALSFGYKHPHHFSRDFRKFFGVSPSRAHAIQSLAGQKPAAEKQNGLSL